tara:strand:- start:197 stop:421 length:225 start_codon:yes stop_codon:yes gene_type:complete
MKSINKALIRGTIVLIPTYIVAYITDKMVYVVPMLAACGFIAASLFENDTKQRIDDNATGKDSFKDFNEDGEGE